MNRVIIERVLGCLVDHATRTTENENLYNDKNGESCTFSEVGQVVAYLELLALDKECKQ